MKPEAYHMIAARDRDYWWNHARRFMASALLRRYGLAQGCRFLDLGCGPGGNLAMLDALRPSLVAGIDLSPIAIDFARQRAPDARLVRADINAGLPFTAAAFDAVTIFNVLYHSWMPSETAVLNEVFRVLRPGGLALITEPAFSVLEREMDEVAMGRRRYRLREIAALCRTARLDVVFGSYFTSFGFPILLALKLAKRVRRPKRVEGTAQAADMNALPPLVNAAMYQAARLEARLITAGVRMPFGVTLVCLARRPVNDR